MLDSDKAVKRHEPGSVPWLRSSYLCSTLRDLLALALSIHERKTPLPKIFAKMMFIFSPINNFIDPKSSPTRRELEKKQPIQVSDKISGAI